ncbi:MAG: hypothetical protein JWP17_1496 [Solirubrobacterales bacterium]|nr:hypothetical protein [Solirubrobacterales bacterium]
MIGKRLARAGGALLALLVVLFANARRLLNTDGSLARTTISSADEHTTTNAEGAVTSTQEADIDLPEDALHQLWNAHSLERLARTYWRFLTRITLGAIQVRYREDGRDICLFGFAPLSLLTFRAPEYELEQDHGIVRWRIDKGLLVSRRGHGGDGFLEIDVRRCPSDDPARGRLHVEVEVANFYPAIASSFGRWIYANTQSRIHVIVTHGFLRSLARLDLARSRVGRFPAGT